MGAHKCVNYSCDTMRSFCCACGFFAPFSSHVPRYAVLARGTRRYDRRFDVAFIVCDGAPENRGFYNALGTYRASDFITLDEKCVPVC